MSAKMRSDMYSDQRPSRVPIFHLSRRLAAATVLFVCLFFHVFSSRLSYIITRVAPHCVNTLRISVCLSLLYGKVSTQ